MPDVKTGLKRRPKIDSGETTRSRRRRTGDVAGELWRDKGALIGAIITLGFLLFALVGPWLISDGSGVVDVNHRLQSPMSGDGSGILGTDALGRDLFGRLIDGARTSLIVCTTVVLLAGVAGTLVGLITGFTGGILDTIVSRYVEIQGAFPALLLALLVLAVIRPGMKSVIIVLAIERWPYFVKVARGATLSLRQKQYVEGAEIVGCSTGRVLFKHILPGVMPPVLTLAVLDFAHVILAEATLSYLGFGIQPPTVSWGLMINEGQDYIFDSWWLVVFPGIAVALTVIGMNLLGGWLQVIMNPHERQKRFSLIARAKGGVS